ncbi:hypothetical protein [Asticcacaulis sp. AND118]|uniref:hypothetical protein n=1 Tax=Asticcacaulis sp. AND118 TaxID=2840468 RepID=UPI001CFF5EFE|nr:hypothetical protein [Asticcacaulis sp. AND118]UDF03318.1 hypothetical protein LH365_12890 [Asticcacaulis sp. AND118]
MNIVYLSPDSATRKTRNAMPGTTERPQTHVVTSPRPGVEVIQPYQQVLNRRIEPRFDCNAAGALIMLTTGNEIPCQIVNQSASGAQVIHEGLPQNAGEMWLIDVQGQTVKFGTPAWTQPHKTGLRFSFVQKIDGSGVRPPRVPMPVWKAWRRLAGLDTPPPADDVIFLD